MVVFGIRMSNIFIRLRLSFMYFYEIKTLLNLVGYYFFVLKFVMEPNKIICTVTLSKDFFVYLFFFFIKNLGKVHCIHCHPSIKCSLNICSFSPSLQKKV